MAVAISTAVIGGSMIVGDSVRYSLRQMTRQRLGDVTHVVHGRFVREQLARDVAESLRESVQATRDDVEVAPAILVTAGVELPRDQTVRRAGSVGITGIAESGWDFFDTSDCSIPGDGEIVLGYRTAIELNAQIGDTVSVWVELPTSIPRDSLLGEREEVSAEIRFEVTGILDETAGASRFTLNPGQQLPQNAFVALAFLQDRLGLQAIRKGRYSSVDKAALINTLLMHVSTTDNAPTQKSIGDTLKNALHESLTLEDLALRLRVDTDNGYISAETDRMILELPLADGINLAADQLGLRTASTLVYLINEFAAEGRDESDERFSMYSIIGGLPTTEAAPLGPFAESELAEDEIILSHWLQQDLQVEIGDSIEARWHEVGSQGDLPEIRQSFKVAGVLPKEDKLSIDAGLTPTIPGVTDVESFSDWDQPFEMEMNRITSRDDEYWAARRATPKAFVSLATAQSLWSSRYGNATSIRIAADVHPLPEDRLTAIAEQLSDRIPRRCDLAAMGLAPLPVLESGLQAAVGANDFTQLFAGFSFFLILSAVILAS